MLLHIRFLCLSSSPRKDLSINHGLPQILTESDAKGTALYSYGLGRISMADPKKGPMYYQYDGLGSVRSLTDRKGMTRGLYTYDAFGKPLSVSTGTSGFTMKTGSGLFRKNFQSRW